MRSVEAQDYSDAKAARGGGIFCIDSSCVRMCMCLCVGEILIVRLSYGDPVPI